jgi:hypothetical protein
VLVEEVTMSIRPPKQFVRLAKPNPAHITGHHNTHHVFGISPTHSPTRYLIDLTGAQFGISNTVFETGVHMRKHGNKIISITPMGVTKSHLLRLSGTQIYEKIWEGIISRQMQGVADAAEKAVRGFKTEARSGMGEFLRNAVTGYETFETVVLREVDTYVTMYERGAEVAKLPPPAGFDAAAAQEKFERVKKEQAAGMLKYKPRGN